MSVYKEYDFKDLLYYGNKCCNGGRWKRSIQAFEMNIISNTAMNLKAIQDGKYKPKKTNNFKLNERGKVRDIKAHDINDRQVYKTFCNIDLKPKCENYIVPNNSASQPGKGTEHNIKAFRQALAHAYKVCKGRNFYVVTYDFHNYFGSIPHDLSLQRFEEILQDEELMSYLRDYSTIFENGYGIGGEPSQIIAIVYPSKLDRMLLCDPRVIGSCRYMDDGVVITRTLEDAREVEKKIREQISADGLIINEKHTNIINASKSSIPYLKKRFKVLENGKIITQITRKNVTARIRHMKKQKEELENGKRTFESIMQSFQSWTSYATRYQNHKEVMKIARKFSEIFNVNFREVMNIVNGYGLKSTQQNNIKKEESHMGFRINSTMKVWDRYDTDKQNFTKWNVTVSKKDKSTGEWKEEFRDFVIFVGKAKDKAALLQRGDMIVPTEINVNNSYDKETGKKYYDFVVYDFEIKNGDNSASNTDNTSAITQTANSGNRSSEIEELRGQMQELKSMLQAMAASQVANQNVL